MYSKQTCNATELPVCLIGAMNDEDFDLFVRRLVALGICKAGD